MFAGSRNLQIQDETKRLSFPAWVTYPTLTPSRQESVGPFTLDISPDAPIDATGRYPVVIISHGSGGSHLLYRTIGVHLAKNGYIVAMPEHPGNNKNDNTLSGTLENLVYRPRHIRFTIDTILSDSFLGAAALPDNAAIIGHSMGGYTALAVAGATPWSELRLKVKVKNDHRVKALVLLAPATVWYLPEDSLINVKAPVLMLVAEHDSLTPRWQAELVLERIADRDKVIFRVVENAGHFSFISPYPQAMKNSDFPPSMDPEGFDRELFHRQLNAEVVTFLDTTLKRCP